MKNTKILIGFLVIFISASYCGENASTQAEPINEISVTEFSNTFKNETGIKVLDVRSPQEYAEGHVPGAVLFPLQDLQSQGEAAASNIPFSKEDKFYVICRSGGRSLTATKLLTSMGYKNSINVQGGTSGFIQAGNPVEK